MDFFDQKHTTKIHFSVKILSMSGRALFWRSKDIPKNESSPTVQECPGSECAVETHVGSQGNIGVASINTT